MSVGQFAVTAGGCRDRQRVLIAILPLWLLGSATGSGLAAGMYLTTPTFLITTPGWGRAGGLPGVVRPGRPVLEQGCHPARGGPVHGGRGAGGGARRPIFWAMAPVKAPFSWPNNSLSSR